MTKKLLLLCALPLLGACDGKFIRKEFLSSQCFDGGTRLTLEGYTATAIAYGDSHMVVIPLSKVHSNSEFRFRLSPKKQDNDKFDWKDATVVITSEDDDGDVPANWLDVSGTYRDKDGWLVACVPDIQTARQIKYKVSVTKDGNELGMLDPRAEIIPD